MKKNSVSLSKKQARYGRIFVYPWLLGFLIFTFIPFVKSITYSFHDVTLEKQGITLKFVKFDNFINSISLDPNFVISLTKTLKDMMINVPQIIFFSLFIAVMINKPFRGRTFVRNVFFLPVIVTSGALISAIGSDVSAALSVGTTQASGGMPMLQAADFKVLFQSVIRNNGIIELLTLIIDRVYIIVWKSGVQIVLFLAGLQSISSSLYESANVEGATGWESFWKITFPMISPIILVNIVYTVIESFTDYENETISYITSILYKNVNYGLSSAMSWIYFMCVLLLLVVIIALVSRKVFYVND